MNTWEILTGMLIDALVRTFGANLPVFALLFVGIVVEKYYVSE
jgi:hypothetical protein